MTDFILRFDQVKESHRDRSGGKGYALARLCQAEFPVPPGFVVTADAYRAFVALNNLDAVIADALADGDPAMASAFIRAVFEETEIPPSLTITICDSYLALWDGKVAVRSSALSEDSAAASFAGQHKTFLGIAGCDSLLAAVRRCWASLWSERALAYRDHLGFDGDSPAMAVVVQRMVSAAQSGVAFTLDPVSGHRGVTVVEAVAGVGEALVSGQATPHRYVVSEAKGLIQQEEERPQADESVLDAARLAAVVGLARGVESWAGQPQDVEWALDDAGDVYLLQARPITTAPTRGQVFSVSGGASPSPEATRPGFSDAVTLWTRDNVGEVIPDPITPLSWSVLDPVYQQACDRTLHRLGIRETSRTLCSRRYGRVYINQTLFQAMLGRFYLSRVGWRDLPWFARVALRAFWLLVHLPGEGRQLMTSIRALPSPNLDVPEKTLLAEVQVWREREAQVMEVHLAVSVLGILLSQALERSTGSGDVLSRLPQSSEVRSAGAGKKLGVLAEQIASDPMLQEVVLATSPGAWPEILIESGTGQQLLSEMQRFLEEYGHEASQEFELAAPRWRDDPTPVWAALQAHVRILETVPERAQEPAATSLPGTQLVRTLARVTQTFSVLREDLKETFVLAHGYLRDLYLAVGEVMVEAGLLDERETIFFLTHGEIAAWVQMRHVPEGIDTLLNARQAEWKQWHCQSAPFALEEQPDGRLIPQARRPAQQGQDGILQGVAASPGTFAGRACVVRTPEDAATLEAGEVLVSPAVTPGWAPVLRAAGALVTEIGGVLSHGAIIAREYGVPAVVNVVEATSLICTGQLIYVDGSSGTIRWLEADDYKRVADEN